MGSDAPNLLSYCPAEYDEVLEAYVPAVMAQASLYWDKEQYGQVQAVLSQASEFCSEHETWRLNVAHTFFMQVTMPSWRYLFISFVLLHLACLSSCR